jgi:putative transcriptional regulator
LIEEAVMKRTLLALAFALAASAAQAQAIDRPRLLVAAPEMRGLYSRTALIVIPAGDRHVGFILNRATDVRLGTLFPGHAPSAKVADPVHFGGPDSANALFAVVRRNPGSGGVQLFGGLYLVADAEAVDRVIEQTPADARFFAGFVGWQPGELAKEIDAGYWHVTDADAALFFRPDTGSLWDELIARRRFQSASL